MRPTWKILLQFAEASLSDINQTSRTNVTVSVHLLLNSLHFSGKNQPSAADGWASARCFDSSSKEYLPMFTVHFQKIACTIFLFPVGTWTVVSIISVFVTCLGLHSRWCCVTFQRGSVLNLPTTMWIPFWQLFDWSTSTSRTTIGFIRNQIYRKIYWPDLQ